MSDSERFTDFLRDGLSSPKSRPRARAARGPDDSQRRLICPECQIPLTEEDRSAHMISVHDYVAVSGASLPLATALSLLWDRVFSTADVESHDRLLRHLAGSKDGENGDAYAAALEAELSHRLASPNFAKASRLAVLIRNLREANPAHEDFWPLVAADNIHIRRIGRELLMPDVAEALADTKITASDARAAIDQLCPVDDVWEKVQVCKRLRALGASRDACKDCLNHLCAERPVICPECHEAVAGTQLDTHLRQEHGAYQFRGERLQPDAIIPRLLAAVCNENSDPEAWEALESLAQDEYGAQANQFLAVRVSQELDTHRSGRRGRAIEAVAEVVAASPNGLTLAALLAASHEQVARQLALQVVIRTPPPLPPTLLTAMESLLQRKRAPKELQIAAAAALLRSTDLDGTEASAVVGALIRRSSRSRALERLRQLEEQIGPAGALREHFTAIENEMEMICPRCQTALKRPEMARHLWSEHRLVLDGRRAQPPWRAIKEWIKAYRRGGNAELLVRCRTLGQHLHPEQGLERVNRLILASRIHDVEAREMVWARARQEGSSLCPKCFTRVPISTDTVPPPLNESHGRLSARGFSVEISERGLVPRLSLDLPDSTIYRGREPGRWLTRKGATLLFAGLPVLAGLGLAFGLQLLSFEHPWPVVATVLLGLLMYLAVRLRWRYGTKASDRAIDFAWSRLVPHLHAKGFWLDDAGFLAGLAASCVDRGRPQLRARSLQRVVRLTDDAVARGACSANYLVPLLQLEASDAPRLGDDPLPLLVTQIGRCFEGERPLSLAQYLLEDKRSTWRTKAQLARLRVLLCNKAFEAGLEVGDLLAACSLAPALDEVLDVESPGRLAQLRVLWSLRASRPWDRWGRAVTVFELAADSEQGQQWLTKYPDLLLVDEKSPPIIACGRGLYFKNILFAAAPRSIDNKARIEEVGVSYELTIDEHRFRQAHDAASLASRLKSWFHHFFRELQPKAVEALSWTAPGKEKTLYFQEAVPCPRCRRFVLPRLGDVGVLLMGDNER
jgi:hypothetical protein